ncbi:MAG: gas vesicle protein [Planctomycetota bacterium]|nr:gas vesicle protein [Planctomycetota bacterium]
MTVQRSPTHSTGSTNLADLLERVLDKGVVIAGDVKIKLVDIELLSIQLRLVICSVDKAKEMGMDWWVNHPLFSSSGQSKLSGAGAAQIEGKASEVDALHARIAALEARLAATTGFAGGSGGEATGAPGEVAGQPMVMTPSGAVIPSGVPVSPVTPSEPVKLKPRPAA